jgi:hypothetical protein
VFSNEVDEVSLNLDDLLPRPLPRRLDVPRDRQRTGTEMQCGYRLAAGKRAIDDVPDSLDVIEVKFGRVFRVHVRLRGAVDRERPRPRPPRVSRDFGDQTVAGQSALKGAAHVPIIVANS